MFMQKHAWVMHSIIHMYEPLLQVLVGWAARLLFVFSVKT
jgi:hypothetical protein